MWLWLKYNIYKLSSPPAAIRGGGRRFERPRTQYRLKARLKDIWKLIFSKKARLLILPFITFCKNLYFRTKKNHYYNYCLPRRCNSYNKYISRLLPLALWGLILVPKDRGRGHARHSNHNYFFRGSFFQCWSKQKVDGWLIGILSFIRYFVIYFVSVRVYRTV